MKFMFQHLKGNQAKNSCRHSTWNLFSHEGIWYYSFKRVWQRDLHIKVNVTIPQKLTPKQKALLKQFAEISGEEIKEQHKNIFDKMKDAFGG